MFKHFQVLNIATRSDFSKDLNRDEQTSEK